MLVAIIHTCFLSNVKNCGGISKGRKLLFAGAAAVVSKRDLGLYSLPFLSSEAASSVGKSIQYVNTRDGLVFFLLECTIQYLTTVFIQYTETMENGHLTPQRTVEVGSLHTYIQV